MTEILRPVRRVEAGTSWVKTRLVSHGITHTVPLRAGKSIGGASGFVGQGRSLNSPLAKLRPGPQDPLHRVLPAEIDPIVMLAQRQE